MWPFPSKIPEQSSKLQVEKEQSLVEFVSKTGVRFVHLYFPEIDKKLGVTVAYRPANPANSNGKFLELAVAYKHPNDDYNRKVGADLAAQRLVKGQSITMPLRGASTTLTFYNLKAAFYDTAF